MQRPFSLLLPLVICAAAAGFIVLIVASISLILDLIKMRWEYQAGGTICLVSTTHDNSQFECDRTHTAWVPIRFFMERV